jgi:hypothetical protein
MTDKTLRGPHASVGRDERNRALPHVRLYAFAGWLKNEPIVAVDLSALDALKLAEELLQAARFAATVGDPS